MAIELDVNRDVVPAKLPRVEVEPVVGNLDLVAVDDLLLEDTVSVTQAVTPRGIVQGGHAVKEAGGKATKAAVAKGSIVFLADDILDAETKLVKTLCSDVVS